MVFLMARQLSRGNLTATVKLLFVFFSECLLHCLKGILRLLLDDCSSGGTLSLTQHVYSMCIQLSVVPQYLYFKTLP